MGIGQRVSAQLHQIQLCVVLLFVVFALFQSCCQVQTTVDMKPQSERPTFTFFFSFIYGNVILLFSDRWMENIFCHMDKSRTHMVARFGQMQPIWSS